jgi:hypothetical protein
MLIFFWLVFNRLRRVEKGGGYKKIGIGYKLIFKLISYMKCF